MKIVIDIPEHDYNVVRRYVKGDGHETMPEPITDDLLQAVSNGFKVPDNFMDWNVADIKEVRFESNYRCPRRYL